MNTLVPAALLAVTTASLMAQGDRPPAPATIAQLDWLAGTWVGENASTRVEEHWTPAAGGAMLAVARTLKGDRMTAFEFLRIVERDGGLVYVAQPQGRPPTEFTLTAAAGQSATFENPSHDFPRMIRYEKRADGSLEARISDGGSRGQSFVFRKRP